MPQSPSVLITMIKLSNPIRGGNALMNRLRSAANQAGSGIRTAVTPRQPTVMDRVRRGAVPLAALGAAGAGAAGLYASGYGNELMGQATQMGNNMYGQAAQMGGDLYEQATQYGDRVRNADFGNEGNEMLFRMGIRDRGALGDIGQSADDFLDRNGVQLPEGLPPLSTMGSVAESEINRFTNRLPRLEF
jgi:hypothetical protein